MKLDCGFVIYVINRFLIKMNQNTKCCEEFNVFVKKYELIKPNINEIDFIIDKCLRDSFYKYFHTFKFVYDVEMENGHSFMSIRSDKKLNQINRENGFNT